MRSLSQPRTLVLTERRPLIVRLPPVDVAFLIEHHRGHLEVQPSGQRDRYRLTALGSIGVLVAPTCRFVIRPKIPLANIFAMLDPLAAVPAVRDAIAPMTGTETLDFLAGQLARRMSERVAAGLHRAYRERCEQGVMLHGPIDLPAQLRETPGRKDQLHSQYDDLSCDVPCNQVVKTTAEALSLCPLLSEGVRAALQRALAGFQGVSPLLRLDQVRQIIKMDRLPAEYRDLLDLCRLLAESLNLTDSLGPMPAASYLLDMESVFEHHITRGIIDGFKRSSTHKVSVQVPHDVSQPVVDRQNITMRPDVTIDREGKTVLVVDAKWKPLPGNAETADLYQIIAYGTGLGAEGVALVYPGRRWSVQEYRFLHSPLGLNVFTVPVGSTRQKCLRSVRRLARALQTML